MDELERRLKEQLQAIFDGNESELARRLGTDQQNVNNFITGRVKRSHIWREIGALLQISEDEMRDLMKARGRQEGKNTKLPIPIKVADFFHEVPAQPVRMPAESATRMIPVLGKAVGGDDGEYEFNGQPIDWRSCPPTLTNVADAYAIYVDGESMSPRYLPGEIAFVHPDKPPRANDHVVVQLKPTEDGAAPRGFIKKFIGWSPTKLLLEQYNPAKKLDFDRREVFKVHLIVLSGDY